MINKMTMRTLTAIKSVEINPQQVSEQALEATVQYLAKHWRIEVRLKKDGVSSKTCPDV